MTLFLINTEDYEQSGSSHSGIVKQNENTSGHGNPCRLKTWRAWWAPSVVARITRLSWWRFHAAGHFRARSRVLFGKSSVVQELEGPKTQTFEQMMFQTELIQVELT